MEWRPVANYEGLYEVSEAGDIRSLPRPGTRGGILKPDTSIDNPYPSVRLSQNGRKTHLNVHSLVARAFHGEPLPGQECRHLNGDPGDCRASNLEWGTSKQNSADMGEHGTGYAASRTHCPNGHPYDAVNTKLYQGRRYCRECGRKYSRDGQRRRRAAAKGQRA